MKHLLHTIAVLSMLATLNLRPLVAHACSCRQESREEAVRDSSDIFEGRVRSITHGTEADGTRGMLIVELDVVQTWKGASHERVTVRTFEHSAACGYPFREHTSYLVYARNVENHLMVGLCSRTRLMSDAAEDLRALGAGVTPIDIDPNARPRARAGSPSRPRAN